MVITSPPKVQLVDPEMRGPATRTCQICHKGDKFHKITASMAGKLGQRHLRGRFLCHSCYAEWKGCAQAVDRRPAPSKHVCGACALQKRSTEKWFPTARLSDEKKKLLRLPEGDSAPLCVCRACALWADYHVSSQRKKAEQKSLSLFESLSGSLSRLEEHVVELEGFAKAMDVARFKGSCDGFSEGLFTALENATCPRYGCSLPSVEKHGQRIVLLVMLMLRYRNQSVSEFAEMMSDFLSVNGMSYDGQILLAKFGLSLSPSAHSKRMKKGASQVVDMKDGFTYVGIVDDFSWLDVSSTPNGAGNFSTGHTLGNMIVKRVPDSNGAPLSAKGLNDEPLQNWRKADAWRVEAMIDEYHGETKTNWAVTMDLFSNLARALSPYDTRRLNVDEKSPVSVENVVLLDCTEEGMKSKVSIARAVEHFIEVSQECFSSGRAVIVTGDWHLYHGFSDYIGRKGPMYDQILLLPGGFHISLNLQQAVFEHYGPIIELLWRKAVPLSKFTALSCLRKPIRRKFVLDVLNESWSRVRDECLHCVQTASDGSFEAFALIQLFENVIPIACSLYAAQLEGIMDVYLSTLCRALMLFLQFGKNHYYSCCCRLLSDLHFWKQYRPDAFNFVSQNIRYLSEEEIEVFHSTIRPLVANTKTTAQQAIRKIKHFDAVKGEQFNLKKTMNSGVKRKRGFCFAEKAWLGDESECHLLDKAITDLLKSTLRNDVILKPVRKEDHCWSTHHLGTVKDTAFPLPLQSRTELKGCSQAHLRCQVVHDGWLQGIPGRHACGHVSVSGECCQACRKMYSEVVCAVCSHCMD